MEAFLAAGVSQTGNQPTPSPGRRHFSQPSSANSSLEQPNRPSVPGGGNAPPRWGLPTSGHWMKDRSIISVTCPGNFAHSVT